MLRLVIFCCTVVTCATIATSQAVVVSEFLNYPNFQAANEWTELLVIDDNVNIVGWTVHDHGGDVTSVTNGPIFADIPLWRHLRAGTIIVIDHRLTAPPATVDTLPADGYIQFEQHDTRIVQLSGGDIDVNQTGELIVIEDDEGNHVHGLSILTRSGSNSNPIWLATPAPKVLHELDGYPGVNNAHSVRVSGRSLAAYAAGPGQDSTSLGPGVPLPPDQPGIGPSKGLPNRIDNTQRLAGRSRNLNQLFWRELREPKWTQSPSISLVDIRFDRHTISWTPLVDPYPDDRVTGYLILRDTNGFVGFPSDGVRDGRMLTAGTQIGSATVLATQPTLSGTSYTDTDVKCGTNYTYRVYGYRFGADDVLSSAETHDTTARGRQYNEVYAQSTTINKPFVAKPKIFASRSEICPGDTVTLWTDATSGIDLYEWTHNGAPIPIPGTITVVVNQVGQYRLKVTGASGCSAESDPLVINPLPAPSVLVAPLGTQSLCSGDTLWFTVQTPAASYEILRNGNIVSTQTSNRYPITTSGRYSVRIKSGGGCDGVSEELNVVEPDVRYHFEPPSVDFGELGACDPSATATIDLVNDGTRAITLGTITMPAGFAIEFPAPGFVVGPGLRQQVRLRFSPSGTGTITGSAVFEAQPCDVRVNLSLRGERNVAVASLDKAEVDFGSYTACPSTVINDTATFRVTNSGMTAITVTPPIVQPPFYISFSAVTIQPGQSVPITVRFIPLATELNMSHSQTISFPFTSASCTDTLQATLRAATYQPSLTIIRDTIDAGVKVGCTVQFTGVLTVTNTGKVSATITGSTIPEQATVVGIPVSIPPGETRTITYSFVRSGESTTNVFGDTLAIDPCDISLPFWTRIQHKRPEFTASPSLVNLGTIRLCSQVKESQDNVRIRSSEMPVRDTIASVYAQAPFRCALTPGTIFTDSVVANITFAPTASGVFDDSVVIVLKNCGDRISIPVSGIAVNVARTSSMDNPDFGVLAPAGSADRRFVVVNTGSDSLIVLPIEGVTPPWSIVREVPLLPATIAPSDSAVVELRYSYTTPGRTDTITISSSTQGPCSDTYRVNLTGATSREPDTVGKITGLVLTMPQNTTAIPGSTVSLPIGLTSPQPLSGKGLRSLEATIGYNPTVLKVLEVIAVNPAISTTSVSETAPGQAVLTVTSATEITETAELVRLSGSTFVGNARSTILDVDTVVSAEATITGQDGELILVGDCAINTQIVETGTPPAIRIVGRQPCEDGVVQLDIVTLTDDVVELRVADVQGQVWFERHLRLPPGNHAISIDVRTWPSGWFQAAMHHGLFSGAAPFMLTH